MLEAVWRGEMLSEAARWHQEPDCGDGRFEQRQACAEKPHTCGGKEKVAGMTTIQHLERNKVRGFI
jgi:hypothetical protein